VGAHIRQVVSADPIGMVCHQLARTKVTATETRLSPAIVGPLAANSRYLRGDIPSA
jgi:hypothetical protein